MSGESPRDVHFAHRRLAVIDDFVEIDDGAVDVLPVDGVAKASFRVQVADLDAVGVVFVLADELAGGGVAGFHELDLQTGGVGHLFALLDEEGKRNPPTGETRSSRRRKIEGAGVGAAVSLMTDSSGVTQEKAEQGVKLDGDQGGAGDGDHPGGGDVPGLGPAYGNGALGRRRYP